MIVLAWNHAENHLKYRGYPKCFEVCETRMCSINLPHIQLRETKNTWLRWVYTWARDTVRWYSSAEIPLRQLSIDHNIDVQSVFSWAPKLARKCTRKHWYIYLICTSVYLSNLYIYLICGGGGRSVGQAHDTIGQLNNTKLSSQLLMVILFYYRPSLKRITRLQIYRVGLLVVS